MYGLDGCAEQLGHLLLRLVQLLAVMNKFFTVQRCLEAGLVCTHETELKIHTTLWYVRQPKNMHFTENFSSKYPKSKIPRRRANIQKCGSEELFWRIQQGSLDIFKPSKKGILFSLTICATK
jgi:hypothetical protein